MPQTHPTHCAEREPARVWNNSQTFSIRMGHRHASSSSWPRKTQPSLTSCPKEAQVQGQEPGKLKCKAKNQQRAVRGCVYCGDLRGGGSEGRAPSRRHSQVYGAGSPCCGAGLLGRGSLDPDPVTLSDLWGHFPLPQFLHMHKGKRPEAASWCCWDPVRGPRDRPAQGSPRVRWWWGGTTPLGSRSRDPPEGEGGRGPKGSWTRLSPSHHDCDTPSFACKQYCCRCLFFFLFNDLFYFF